MSEMSKENFERVQGLVKAAKAGEQYLHPNAMKAYEALLEGAEVKRGPGRPKKAESLPAAPEPPHSDYVPAEKPQTES